MREREWTNYIRRHHLSLLCLFLILGGGTAWALDRNSVGSRHIINGQVKAVDVRDNSLTDDEIREATVEPDGFGAFHDGIIPVPNTYNPDNELPRGGDESVLTLDLPAGNYFILAKGQMDAPTFAICRLYADGDFDTAYWLVDTDSPFAMTVLASAPEPFVADLACTDSNNGSSLSELKIHAIPIRDRFNTAK